MTQRQQLRLLLTNLMQARLDAKLAKREYSADSRPETSDRYEKAKDLATRLQEDAERLVERIGTAQDKVRLAALLSIRWLWVFTVDVPI